MSWKGVLEQMLLERFPVVHDWAMLIYFSLPRQTPPPTLRTTCSTVWIETTNACNLNCVMCQTKLSKRPVGYMELGLFEKIIRECRQIGVERVAFHTVGEPFMHKELGEHLRIAHENNVRVSLSTNGQILTPQHVKSIIEFPPHLIRYSIDGATKDTYERTRVGGKFETLMSNLEVMRDAMEQAGVDIPVKIGVVVLEENIHELVLFLDVFKEFVHDSGSIGFSMPNSLSAGESKDYFRGFGTTVTSRVPCRMLWGSTSILYDGRVSACTRDYHGELIMGNILEQSLLDIWNGEKYNNLRKKHLERDVPDIPMCNNCFDSASRSEDAKLSICLQLLHRRRLPFLNRLIGRAFLPPPLQVITRRRY